MACRRDDPLLDDLSSNTHLLIRGKYHSTTGSGLDSAKQVNLIAISTEQSCWIYTSKTGGQLYGNPPPFKVSDLSLTALSLSLTHLDHK